MSKAQSRRRFKWMLAGAVLLLPGLVSLGLWQLERAEQKRILLQSWAELHPHTRLPVDRRELEARFYPVVLKATLDQQRYFLLDNRQRPAGVGYEVIALASLESGERLLVNMGWLAGSADRAVLPEVAIPDGQQALQGGLKLIDPGLVLVDTELAAGWPKVIQSLAADKLSALLGATLSPYELRLQQPIIAGLDLNWPLLRMRPEKHLGYAFQWFAMAAALAGLLIWSWRRLRKEEADEPI
ncbi:SURF1 family protein [Neptuniibacter halophilus]|uniref:SURF1 family protein n=1 Tax=Neptuniibacter halophilus TaxID=651666 RepID=UPI0025733877|nr:SURF1 family protein [Neptuniibacter halophilus]